MLVYNPGMAKLVISIFLAFSLVGCIPDVQLPSTFEQAETQFDRDIANLEKKLSLIQATLAVARPAAAKVCKQFPATCLDLATFQADAELAVADAQKALDRVKETKQGLGSAIDEIAFAQSVIKTFLLSISAVLKSAA